MHICWEINDKSFAVSHTASFSADRQRWRGEKIRFFPSPQIVQRSNDATFAKQVLPKHPPTHPPFGHPLLGGLAGGRAGIKKEIPLSPTFGKENEGEAECFYGE